MKRTLAALLCAVLILTLASCAQQPQNPTLPTQPAEPGSSQSEPEKPADEKPEEEKPSVDAQPTSDLPADAIQKLVDFVRPFNVCPAEFTDASSLTDTALFFAAVTKLNNAFIPDEDGYTYSLDTRDLAPALRSMFGDSAALSDNWQSGDYSPYMVDAAAQKIYKYSQGQATMLFYTLKAVKVGEGRYELWLVDLCDPMFANDNPQIIENGDEDAVSFEMISKIYMGMQTNVYTIALDDGGYRLAGFRYENFKNVSHVMY